jgi:hypothetical protein
MSQTPKVQNEIYAKAQSRKEIFATTAIFFF